MAREGRKGELGSGSQGVNDEGIPLISSPLEMEE